jgi:hypothetical protein
MLKVGKCNRQSIASLPLLAVAASAAKACVPLALLLLLLLALFTAAAATGGRFAVVCMQHSTRNALHVC